MAIICAQQNQGSAAANPQQTLTSRIKSPFILIK